MRLNKFLAAHSALSRRAADAAIIAGRVQINDHIARVGRDVTASDRVTLDGQVLTAVPVVESTIVLHKPRGYVVSRRGQGSQTIYDLLPETHQHLQPVGRLDKESSGLLILTNNGQLHYELTHPKFVKPKKYLVALDKPLQPLHQQMISDYGVQLDDGPSKFFVTSTDNASAKNQYQVILYEGRNRQIRRTFAALGYTVTALHRTEFADYSLGDLPLGQYRSL